MVIMMKRSTKRILAGLTILVVVGILVWRLKYSFRIPEVKGETFLRYIPAKISPAQPLAAVIGLNNFEDIFKNLKESNFYKTFIQSNIYNNLISDTDISDKKVMDILGENVVVAVYNSNKELPYFVFISKIRDITGVKQLIHKKFKDTELTVEEHLGVEIDVFSDNGYYAVLDGIFIAANSLNLIKSVIDIKKNTFKGDNFNAAFGWVEGIMDIGVDGFMFISHREINGILKETFRIEMRVPAGYTYQEFFIDKGVHSKIYTPLPDKDAKAALSRAVSISFVPERTMIYTAFTGIDVEKEWEKLSGTGYAGLFQRAGFDVKKDVIPYLGREFGYAILGPNIEGVKLALPVILLFAEVKNEKAQENIAEKIYELIKIDAKTLSYSGVEYKYCEFPILFGQKVEICTVPLNVKGKNFILISSSKETVEKVIDLSKRKGKSLKESPAFREVASYLPTEYSHLAYLDISSLIQTVGAFVAGFRGDVQLKNLINMAPLSWAAPMGSAGTFYNNYSVMHSYLPIQDLSIDKWKEIFTSLDKLIAER